MFVSVTLSCCFVSLRTCMCQLLVLVTAWLSQPTVWERVGGNKPQPRHPGQKTKDWRPDNLAALRSTLIFSLNQPARHPTPVSRCDYTHRHISSPPSVCKAGVQSGWEMRFAPAIRDVLLWGHLSRSIGFEDPLHSVSWAQFVHVEGTISTLSQTYLLPAMVHLAVEYCVS